MKARTKKILLWAFPVAAAVALLFFLRYQTQHPATDDAFLQGYVIAIAPQVSGPVISVPISDNQPITKGELLFEIDPAPFQLALDQAKANLALARQNFEVANAQVQAAEALIASRKASVENFQTQFDRLGPLVKAGAETPIAYEGVTSQLKAAKADLNEALDELQRAQIARGTEQTNPHILAAQAAVATAELNLSYTKITAPCDGFVTNCNLAPGNYVNTGTPVFAVVQKNTFWLSANFRETELRKIRPGMPVRVTLRSYPGIEFQGEVQGTGWAIFQPSLAKALVPEVSPTIDWVQLAQRFPVRINLVNVPLGIDLRVGASGSATVYIGEKPSEL